ncbi:hypothetical protein EC844_11655 [Acinetobacter calcoaceticus]|uniref:Lipoprotein n=1 Tax=Acinetobacter calcoaceticus TaxID=471 RepID=A0A4R1XPL3_ACICA|nr:hypothetical protein EC844_11655 [Acinetobacter calcoaceticus]
MRIFLISLMALILTACSKPHDKYLGYWKLEESKFTRILEIKKEDKETYLVNENILREADLVGNKKKEQVLEKKEDQLGVNNGLTVIPFNLSDDGKVLRIKDQKYSKISEDEAKSTVKNTKDCRELAKQFIDEKKPFDGLFFSPNNINPNQAKLDAVKTKYSDLQKKIPECDFKI